MILEVRFKSIYYLNIPKVLEEHQDGSLTFMIIVHHNFELERLLLGFGDSLEVLAPRILRRNIKRKLELASSLYK